MLKSEKTADVQIRIGKQNFKALNARFRGIFPEALFDCIGLYNTENQF